MRILPSVHGNLGGFGNKRATGAQPFISRGGFIAGPHGSQFEMPSPRRVVLFDDFLGDLVADEWNYVETDTDGTGLILAGGIGGVFRLTAGNDDANGTVLTDLVGITSSLNWQAANGDLVFQTRIKCSRITDAYIFAGFTDVVTVEAPVISASGTTFTSNADDCVGFMFDTNMTADNWWLTGSAATVDATMQNAGVAPVADDYETLRIEVNAAGAATFYRNGRAIGSMMAGALTPATDLTPCVYVSSLETTTPNTLDIDYVFCAMNRAADGDAT